MKEYWQRCNMNLWARDAPVVVVSKHHKVAPARLVLLPDAVAHIPVCTFHDGLILACIKANTHQCGRALFVHPFAAHLACLEMPLLMGPSELLNGLVLALAVSGTALMLCSLASAGTGPMLCRLMSVTEHQARLYCHEVLSALQRADVRRSDPSHTWNTLEHCLHLIENAFPVLSVKADCYRVLQASRAHLRPIGCSRGSNRCLVA